MRSAANAPIAVVRRSKLCASGSYWCEAIVTSDLIGSERTQYLRSLATNRCAVTDHGTAANNRGASITNRSARSNATGTVHTAGAHDGACFHSTRGDETSD